MDPPKDPGRTGEEGFSLKCLRVKGPEAGKQREDGAFVARVQVKREKDVL